PSIPKASGSDRSSSTQSALSPSRCSMAAESREKPTTEKLSRSLCRIDSSTSRASAGLSSISTTSSGSTMAAGGADVMSPVRARSREPYTTCRETGVELKDGRAISHGSRLRARAVSEGLGRSAQGSDRPQRLVAPVEARGDRDLCAAEAERPVDLGFGEPARSPDRERPADHEPLAVRLDPIRARIDDPSLRRQAVDERAHLLPGAQLAPRPGIRPPGRVGMCFLQRLVDCAVEEGGPQAAHDVKALVG